jgi:IS5 family transposase
MRPKQCKTTDEGDPFRARLDQIIDMKHELVQRRPARLGLAR